MGGVDWFDFNFSNDGRKKVWKTRNEMKFSRNYQNIFWVPLNAGGKAHCQHFHIEDDIYIEQPVHDVMLADGSIVDFALYTLLKKT